LRTNVKLIDGDLVYFNIDGDFVYFNNAR